eukprot:CAMPEP_0185825558 /NCGR_PEP_ID=MMETSP1322-20130828/31106_1 /TAXON_ID=265543 /ORGANISM="Minutocellus polymorphus, Strain RCC2270" /LENGTH=210 /DNA_ID=CAMNT_0028523281 /DNA_START=83 /DNA_END=715 /DNA_ORIENTATION=+
MKFLLSSLALIGSAAAFAPAQTAKSTTALNAVDIGELPGRLAPNVYFDPLGFSDRADEALINRYREAELTHGRVAMLATIGFLVGEKVEGSSFLFDSQITGPAITHITQVPSLFWALLITAIGATEAFRLEKGWEDPVFNPVDKPGQLKAGYVPGDLGFDPLSLTPQDAEGFFEMQNKELNNGRLAMIAAAGFLAQEAMDGKGILEHLGF